MTVARQAPTQINCQDLPQREIRGNCLCARDVLPVPQRGEAQLPSHSPQTHPRRAGDPGQLYGEGWGSMAPTLAKHPKLMMQCIHPCQNWFAWPQVRQIQKG